MKVFKEKPLNTCIGKKISVFLLNHSGSKWFPSFFQYKAPNEDIFLP